MLKELTEAGKFKKALAKWSKAIAAKITVASINDWFLSILLKLFYKYLNISIISK